jgi:hypothetical protein
MNASDLDLEAGRRETAGGASAADWLGLAAAPAFAVMALLTATSSGGAAEMLCARTGVSPLGGMVPMYLLMSALHLTPWLKLVGRRCNGARP